MKISVHGPRAGYGPSGMIESWSGDQDIEIADGNKKAVAWARMFVATGAATLIEDVADVPRRGPGRPPKVSQAEAGN